MANCNLINDFESAGMTEPLHYERRKAVKSPFRAPAMPPWLMIKGDRS
jgi:hypothetical protein